MSEELNYCEQYAYHYCSRCDKSLKAQLAAVTKERDGLQRELERHASIEEKAHLQTIDERDAAEEALSQAYYLVTGRSPEWSNLFGHQQALEDIDDAQRCLRPEIKANGELQAENASLREAFKKYMAGDGCILGPYEQSLGPNCCGYCSARAALKDRP